MSECKFPTCRLHADSNGYCIRHKIYEGSKVSAPAAAPVKKVQKPIRPKTKKLAAKEREYHKIVREMLAQNPYCELHTPDCTGNAQGLHHMKGRGVNLLVRKHLKRACNACNRYVEHHPKYALEHGLSISKLKKDQS